MIISKRNLPSRAVVVPCSCWVHYSCRILSTMTPPTKMNNAFFAPSLAQHICSALICLSSTGAVNTGVLLYHEGSAFSLVGDQSFTSVRVANASIKSLVIQGHQRSSSNALQLKTISSSSTWSAALQSCSFRLWSDAPFISANLHSYFCWCTDRVIPQIDWCTNVSNQTFKVIVARLGLRLGRIEWL